MLLQGSLLKQLAIANKSVGGGVVVILAERDKEEMELDIAKLEFDFMGTSVICRSGSPLILADLKKVRWVSLIFLLYTTSTNVVVLFVEGFNTMYFIFSTAGSIILIGTYIFQGSYRCFILFP